MGEPLADFSVQGVSRRSCLCPSTFGTAGCECSCDCCRDEAFEAEIACGQDVYIMEEIGTILAEGMYVYDHGGSDLDEDSDENDAALLSLESDSNDDLVGAETDVVISPAFTCGDASESSIDKSYYENPSINATPPLVSAMKGTRAKQGIVTKMSVSWAPDVYDPPVTSDSHTVKGHQRSSRKSHYKYKPSKSSSSSTRSANSSKRDKKHSRHSSGSSSGNRRDKKHSYRSSSSSISRTEFCVSQDRKAYSTSSNDRSRTDSHSIESAKAFPLVPLETAVIPEVVPVLKTIDQIKCATSCKEKPFNLLSRQFSPARYKGMFSFWSQNQLAS